MEEQDAFALLINYEYARMEKIIFFGKIDINQKIFLGTYIALSS
ncbi:hypothetical protein [Bacillus sp. FJAT-49736]|nr:hypothetical protein [Bacillus sp. FJAT-49736]